MKSKTTHLAAIAATALLGGIIQSQAATIIWGSATTISGDLDVSTTGTFVYAEHWGGTNNTVNGVAFSAAQNNVVASGGVGVNANIGAPGSLSAAYKDILKGNWYQASGQTVTLNNLTNNQEYLVQIWVADVRYASNQKTTISGGPSLDINNGGFGDFVIGTFTADGTTQSIGFGGNGVVNAIQLRAIPEPSAALLGGLGMLALLRRRR